MIATLEERMFPSESGEFRDSTMTNGYTRPASEYENHNLKSRPDIPSVLREYRLQEEQLLLQLERALAVDPSGTKVARGLMGELGALAADELLGLRTLGRQVGKAFVNGQQKQSAQAATHRYTGKGLRLLMQAKWPEFS